MKKLIVLAVVVLGFAATSFAQTQTATATATTTLLKAITLTNNANLDFGQIFITSGIAGTLAIAPTAAGTLTATNVIIRASTGTAAKFTITGGDKAKLYAITVSATVDLTNGPNTLTLTPSKSDVSAALAAGSDGILYIGGSLTIPATAPIGTYTTTTPITVTVNNN